jgi:hypothetical protein
MDRPFFVAGQELEQFVLVEIIGPVGGIGPAADYGELQHAVGKVDYGRGDPNRIEIEQRKVEPNSSLGEAISYMLKHFNELTLFLRQPGAPLDNNVCERALKKAILHRKNAYFYKTKNGARVGDLFMSLIHTCELNDINAFDYLTELQKHANELTTQPANWMPWNCWDTLQKTNAS